MKISKFSIRGFSPKDLARVLEIGRASFIKDFEIAGFDEEGVKKKLRLYGLIKLVERLTHKTFFRMYVGEVGNLVVGTMSLMRLGESWYIGMGMVDPMYRKRGYARRLMSRVCSDAMSLGARKVIVYVIEDNVPVKNLCRSMGFVTFERIAYFHRETCKLDGRDLPSGYKLIKIDSFSREASEVVDACRDETSRLVHGKSSPTPFYIRLASRFLRAGEAEKYAVTIDNKIVGVYTHNFKSKNDPFYMAIHLYEEHKGKGIEETVITNSLGKAFDLGIPELIVSFNEKNTGLEEICEELSFAKYFVAEGMSKILVQTRPSEPCVLSSRLSYDRIGVCDAS